LSSASLRSSSLRYDLSFASLRSSSLRYDSKTALQPLCHPSILWWTFFSFFRLSPKPTVWSSASLRSSSLRYDSKTALPTPFLSGADGRYFLILNEKSRVLFKCVF